jgi:hypothetical protein
MKLNGLVLCLLFFTHLSYGQNKISYKFGKISPEEFVIGEDPLEEGADAIYLYRSARIFGDILVYQFRIKILTEEGLDMASWKLPYNKGIEESIRYISAESNTLENGKIVKTEINQKEVYIEDLGDDYRKKSFTIPNVKVGSIVEIKYKIDKQLNFYLPTFYFQTKYPVKKAKLVYQNTDYVTYASILTGIEAKNVTKDEGFYNYSDVPDREWKSYVYTIENLPAFKKEDLVLDYEMYILKIRFQAHSTTRSGILYKDWNVVAKELKQKLYGILTGQKSLELLADYKDILGENVSELEKVRKIVSELQKDYLVKDYLRIAYNSTLVKKVYRDKSGTPAEVNMLAGVIFFYGDIEVEPIFLSTNDNGIVDVNYPFLDAFNHFVWKFSFEEQDYIIDIRNKFAPIELIQKDLIGVRGLNFSTKVANWYSFTNNIKTKKEDYFSTMTIENGEVKGGVKIIYKDYAASEMREYISDVGLSDFKNSFIKNTNIENLTYENVNDNDKELIANYNFNFAAMKISEDEFAINPFATIASQKNIFNGEGRISPVELELLENYTKKIEIILPAGFEVKELPENLSLSLDNLVSIKVYYGKSDGKVQVMSKVKFKTLYFKAEEYEALKVMFNKLISKEKEMLLISII